MSKFYASVREGDFASHRTSIAETVGEPIFIPNDKIERWLISNPKENWIQVLKDLRLFDSFVAAGKSKMLIFL